MSYFAHYPSLELQALVQVHEAKLKKEERMFGTEWNAFAVELFYSPKLSSTRQQGETLIIFKIDVPPRYQNFKWLIRYCHFCSLLAERIIISTNHPWVEACLKENNISYDGFFWVPKKSDFKI